MWDIQRTMEIRSMFMIRIYSLLFFIVTAVQTNFGAAADASGNAIAAAKDAPVITPNATQVSAEKIANPPQLVANQPVTVESGKVVQVQKQAPVPGDVKIKSKKNKRSRKNKKDVVAPPAQPKVVRQPTLLDDGISEGPVEPTAADDMSWLADDEKSDDSMATTSMYLDNYLNPWEHDTSGDMIEFLFENAELSALIKYVEQQFDVVFILDDSIQPLPQGGKSVMGTKISFKTHSPLSKKEAWNLFVAFLDMAGLTPVPGPGKNIYKLAPSQDPKAPNAAVKSPLPTFIGVDPTLIPNNDTRIRYVYFVENTSLDVIKNVIGSMQSISAPSLIPIPELNAILITDKAANIKAMLAVVKELDQSNAPEALAVVKLRHTDASKAAGLYEALAKKDASQGLAARLLGGRKTSTTDYFSDNVRVIPEPRTNSLIILGPRESIQKITNFITNIVDPQDTTPDVPLYTYKLKYLDAEATAKILNEVVQFQPQSEAAKAGGVRDNDKYLRPMSITPEKTTNSLVINADYEDYSKVNELLQKLDIEQPQVALKVFIISVVMSDQKALGIQWRNKVPVGVVAPQVGNFNFQTSGLAPANTPISENPNGTGATRLLGDLINLATAQPVGSTLVTLGIDQFGVWGLLNMLQTYTQATVLANPFLVTTHKYPAQFTLGQIRRVINAQISATNNVNTFTDMAANLSVRITPQISKDGLIMLDVAVDLDDFDTPETDITITAGNRTTRHVESSVIVADNEVLALGGVIRETTRVTYSYVPILGSIPLLGWLFKNKNKQIDKTSLLILILPEIIAPADIQNANHFTRSKLLDSKEIIEQVRNTNQLRDPIHRLFFQDAQDLEGKYLDEFAATREKYVTQVATAAEEFEHKRRGALQETQSIGEPKKIVEKDIIERRIETGKVPTISVDSLRRSPKGRLIQERIEEHRDVREPVTNEEAARPRRGSIAASLSD